MFIIVHNNLVILGPMRWNRFRFENEIQEECELAATLPDSNLRTPITVSENISVLPVLGIEYPSHNSKIQHLHGPFWEFAEVGATGSYIVQSLPMDFVKEQLRAECAAERYRKEISGTKVIIQNTEVTVDTERGSRDIFVQKFLLMSDTDTVQWKFPECWLVLTKADLGQIVAAGATHIQGQFNWEADKIVEIDACETLEQLNLVEITVPVQPRMPGVL